MQVAIVDLLASWNVRASISVGHSSGEIAAAYASHAISRESAWMIAYFRGMAVGISQMLKPSNGAMIAVQAPLESWKNRLDEQNAACPDDPVVIACYNSSQSFTVSGPREGIAQLTDTLREAEIQVHVLRIDVAYHSHHMKPVAEVYDKLLRKIEAGKPITHPPLFVSTVTGAALEELADLRTAAYWNSNLTGSVQFSSALQNICARPDASTYCFVEIGPHSVLRSPLADILRTNGRDAKSEYVSVLRRDRAADTTALECAGKLHTLGANIDLTAVNKRAGPRPNVLTSLPSYAFEDKKRYWLEGRTSIQYRQTRFVHHELLGSRTPDWNEHEARWTNRILLDQSPYLKDHRINGLCLMPAAGMLVMAIEAVRQFYSDGAAAGASGYKVKDVSFTKAMTLSEDVRGTEIQLTLRPGSVDARDTQPGSAWSHFSLYVYENTAWHLCCSGSVAIEYASQTDTGEEQPLQMREMARDFSNAATQCTSEISSTEIYNAFSTAGLAYGPTFRGVHKVCWDEQSQATGCIGLRDWEKHARHAYSDAHMIHPAALDTVLQMTFPAYSIYAKNASATTVPTGFSNAWFSADLGCAASASEHVRVHAKVTGRGFRNKLFAVTAADESMQRVYFCGELETSTIGRNNGSVADGKEKEKSLYRIDWQPATFPDAATVVSASSKKTVILVVYDDADARQQDVMQKLQEIASPQYGLEAVAVPWTSVMQHEVSNATCIFLPGIDGTLLLRMQEDDLDKIKYLVSSASAVIWPTLQSQDLSQSPTDGLVSGLIRTLATESEDYRLVSVSLNGEPGLDKLTTNVMKVVQTMLQPQTDPEDEYCEIDGVLCTPRVVDDDELVAQVLPSKQISSIVSRPWSELESPVLTIGAAGILNTLHYEQSALEKVNIGVGDVIVEVKAVGLNTRDLQVALGQVHDDALGIEIAGVVVQTSNSIDAEFKIGDRVFGVTRNGVAQKIHCKSFQLQRIPERIGFAEAAAYPIASCTAYYGLVQRANIQNGDSILVHNAASPLGQAAIKVCGPQGCDTIFATVNSTEELEFVTNGSNIPTSHVFLAGDPDLEPGIRQLTSGRGVDVILGSTDTLRNSWRCIAPFGRIIDTGEEHAFVSTANRSNETSLPPIISNVTFVNINFQELSQSRIFKDTFEHVHQRIDNGLYDNFGPLTLFKQSEVEQAFRALQEKPAAKVVIEMDSQEVVDVEVVPNAPQPTLHGDATYLIAGAFGGIGQSIVQWMVHEGAKYLVLPSRAPIEGTDREQFVQKLQAQGVVVKAPVCDIAEKSNLHAMLNSLSDLPEIRGCIQAAMVMRDSSFANMSIDKWQQSLAPKVAGSWNLHEALPSDLDFFVMLSSSTGIMGSFGQSNYTVGNTYQDALAAHRMRHGQRAHTLALSMVTGVGYVAQNEQVQALLRVRGMLEEVSMEDIHNLLRYCCDASRVDASTIGSQIITPLTLPADLRAMGIVAPLGSTRPIYHYLDTLPARIASTTETDKSRPSYMLAEATSLVQAIDIIVSAIQSQLSSLLVVSKDDIDPQKAIYRYGVDSLVAVEMRNWFSKAVGADVATADIMSDVSIWLLAVKVASTSRFVKDELKE